MGQIIHPGLMLIIGGVKMIFTHLLRVAFSREPKGTALILPDRIVVQFDPARKHCSMLPTAAIKSFLNFNEIFT